MGLARARARRRAEILNSNEGRLLPVNAAHVWLEELSSGRVVASGRTDSSGAFRIGCVPPAAYRAIIEYLDSLAGSVGPDQRRGVQIRNRRARLSERGDKRSTANRRGQSRRR